MLFSDLSYQKNKTDFILMSYKFCYEARCQICSCSYMWQTTFTILHQNEILIYTNHTRVSTPKCVTSGVAYLRSLAPGLLSSEETSHPWRAVGNTVFDLTDAVFEP